MFHLRSTCKEEINSLKVTASSYKDEVILLRAELADKKKIIGRMTETLVHELEKKWTTEQSKKI